MKTLKGFFVSRMYPACLLHLLSNTSLLDPRGSGLLFFMFIRPQPYTCLGIEWLTQGGVVYYFSCL